MRTHNVGQRQACGKSGAVAAASRCGAAGTRVRMCSVHPCRAPLTYRFNTGVGSAVRGEWSNSTRGVCLPQRRAAQMLRRETGVTDGRRQIPLNFWNAGSRTRRRDRAASHTHRPSSNIPCRRWVTGAPVCPSWLLAAGRRYGMGCNRSGRCCTCCSVARGVSPCRARQTQGLAPQALGMTTRT